MQKRVANLDTVRYVCLTLLQSPSDFPSNSGASWFHEDLTYYTVAYRLPTISQQLGNSKVNNYAKFVLLPMLISLGINYAWLDIDIFLAQNPTSRLLELAESADVLTTDHFDETCLNHGATLIYFGISMDVYGLFMFVSYVSNYILVSDF